MRPVQYLAPHTGCFSSSACACHIWITRSLYTDYSSVFIYRYCVRRFKLKSLKLKTKNICKIFYQKVKTRQDSCKIFRIRSRKNNNF